jgi:hypothetical protein
MSKLGPGFEKTLSGTTDVQLDWRTGEANRARIRPTQPTGPLKALHGWLPSKDEAPKRDLR